MAEPAPLTPEQARRLAQVYTFLIHLGQRGAAGAPASPQEGLAPSLPESAPAGRAGRTPAPGR